jgi:hypothetical protein
MVSKIQKLLEQMKNNQQDWTIADLERLCNHFGVEVRAGKGSHVYLTFPSKATLSIPAKRPIKAVYIISFLALLETQSEQEGSSL